MRAPGLQTVTGIAQVIIGIVSLVLLLVVASKQDQTTRELEDQRNDVESAILDPNVDFKRESPSSTQGRLEVTVEVSGHSAQHPVTRVVLAAPNGTFASAVRVTDLNGVEIAGHRVFEETLEVVESPECRTERKLIEVVSEVIPASTGIRLEQVLNFLPAVGFDPLSLPDPEISTTLPDIAEELAIIEGQLGFTAEELIARELVYEVSVFGDNISTKLGERSISGAFCLLPLEVVEGEVRPVGE